MVPSRVGDSRRVILPTITTTTMAVIQATPSHPARFPRAVAVAGLSVGSRRFDGHCGQPVAAGAKNSIGAIPTTPTKTA
jgi:hypothetical protein